MKFEKIEEYRRQSESHLERQRKVHAERDSALEEVQALKADYERTLRESIESGKDKGKELDVLSDKIAQATKVFERKDLEYKIVTTMQKRTITPEDVVKSWNEEFRPSYKKVISDPAAAALLKAKLAYIDAYQKYKEAVREFGQIREDVSNTLSPGTNHPKYLYKLRGIDFDQTKDSDVFYIKERDLYDLSIGKSPDSVKYVREAE